LRLQLETLSHGEDASPFNQVIEYERRRWAPFKRALPKEDKEAFDRMFEYVKEVVQSEVYLVRPWAFEVIMMAMLLEQQKLLEAIEHELQSLWGQTLE